jgi:hypothetical protein
MKEPCRTSSVLRHPWQGTGFPLWVTGDRYVTALQQVGQVQSGENRLKSRIFRAQVALVSLIFAVIINIET